MIFKIFDKDEEYICNLKNLITASHEEELNGKDILEFSILGSNKNADKLEKKGRVIYKDRLGDWKEFIIQRIEEEHNEEGLVIEVYCESSFYETFGDYIDDKRPQNVTADVALGVALAPTRWNVGRVDNLGINSTNFYHLSSKEAVHKIAEVWQGEIKTRVEVVGNRITRRYVDLLYQRGHNTGKRYEYNKDLHSIIRTVQEDDVITALYGYGQGEHIEETDGYGRRINFADVEWSKAKGDPIDKPLGQKWLGIEENKEIWGRNNPDGTKAHVFGKVDYDDIEEPEELIKTTWEEYKIRSQPRITYEGKVIDLKELKGKEHEGVGLGDTVAVIDKGFSPILRIIARVISHIQDLLNPANDEVVLGNFIDDVTSSLRKQGEYIDQFRGKQGVWDRSKIIGEDGNINAQYLENLIGEMNERLNSQGGYVYLSEDGKGLTTYNKPIDQNPTMAIQLLGGAFRIANRRKPNGEFDWRTFGDGDGFVADMIVAGVLQGGKVRFDLTNGTLFIGDSPDDYVLLFDGQDLHLSGDFRTYQDGYLATELKGNSYMFYDWEGRTTDSMNVGAFSVSRRYGDIDKPGMRINHRKEGHFSIMHLTDTGYSAYVDFDAQNNLGSAFPNYPIKFKEPTMFYYDTKIDNARNLFFGDQGRIVEQANGGFRIEFNGGLGKGLRIITSGGTPILDYPNDNYEIWLRRKTFVNGDFRVSGSKNAVVKTEHYGERLLNSLETPESYFQDKGSGKTSKDGYCYIHTDDIFDETVNTDMQYHVEIQEYGEGTLRPIERNPRYFVVKGTPNLDFGWTLTAKRKGYEYHRLETPDSFEEEEETNIDYLIENEEEKQANEELKNIVEKELTFDLADYVLGGE